MIPLNVVFAGPSAQGVAFRGADVWPPVRRGDVLRAIDSGAETITIIDGYFAQCPAVLHKEILEAISVGLTVFGAASMGALRAAELAPFGMIGVGRVFELYRREELIGDDEVAVLHAPAEFGYASLTFALVNLRATCHGLVTRRLLKSADALELIEYAKSLPIQERELSRVVSQTLSKSNDCDEHQQLLSLLSNNWMDIKRQDAILVARRMHNKRQSRLNRTYENRTTWFAKQAADYRIVPGTTATQSLALAALRHYSPEFRAIMDDILVDGVIARFGDIPASSTQQEFRDRRYLSNQTRLVRLRSGAKAAFERFRQKQPLVTKLQAAGAALKIGPGAGLDEWTNMEPCEVDPSHLSCAEGDRFADLAFCEFVQSQEWNYLRAPIDRIGDALRRVLQSNRLDIMSFVPTFGWLCDRYVRNRGMSLEAISDFSVALGYGDDTQLIEDYRELVMFEELTPAGRLAASLLTECPQIDLLRNRQFLTFLNS